MPSHSFLLLTRRTLNKTLEIVVKDRLSLKLLPLPPALV